MTKDLNHGICNIEYNCINLPSRVDFLDGSKVLYTYDAKGTKLRTDYYINPMTAVAPQTTNEQCASSATNLKHTWTDYCGNFIYENDTLKQTLIEGGYISYEYPQNTAVTSISQLAPTYHFYVQDHLGNNRLVVDEGGTIEQINHYYPYGGLMGESKNISSNQRYKYNGKEFDRMHGLDWYDYGARFHDPATVRWFSVDPLSHKYYSMSPYVYCANDPVKHIDPDGKQYTYKSTDGTIYLYSNGDFYLATKIEGVKGYVKASNQKVVLSKKSNNIMRRTLLALRALDNSKDAVVKKVFDEVNNSKEYVHEFHIAKSGDDPNSTEGKSCVKSETALDLDGAKKASDFNGVGISDTEVVGHEVKHGYDQMNYTKRSGTINGIDEDEVWASAFENRIRKTAGHKLRRFYGGKKIPSRYLEKTDVK